MARLVGLSAVGHIAAAMVAAALVLCGIFFADGTLATFLIIAGAVVAVVDLGLKELRTYRERTGPAFPGDHGSGFSR